MKLRILAFGLSSLLLAPVASFAQSTDWSYRATVYMFAAETKTKIGDVESKLSFSDALENLDVAFMGTFVASNQKWTFVADINHFNLGFSDRGSGILVDKVKTDVKTTLFTGYALYRVFETPGVGVNLGGGFRHFSVDTKLTANGGLLDGRSVSFDDSWTDPVVAMAANVDLSEKWRTTFVADYGSFKNDRKTYQLTWTFDYSFADNWLARFGYRYVKVENNSGNRDFMLKQSGPVLGVTYQF